MNRNTPVSRISTAYEHAGIEVRLLKMMTGESMFNEVFFTDVRVPRKNVGEPGSTEVANATLTHERGTLGDLTLR